MSFASVIRVGVTLAVTAGILAVGPLAWAQDADDHVVGLRHRVDRLEAQLAELEGTVSELQDPLEPRYVTVDCGAGQTVGAALAEAQGHIGPLQITVEGVCEETVQISRDDVTLAGAFEGDGLRSPSSTEDVLSLSGVNRIFLHQLTVSRGLNGIRASDGASFRAVALNAKENALWGVLAERGASAYLYDCTLESNAHSGAASETGIGVFGASTVAVFELTISANGSDGILLADMSHGLGGWGGVQVINNGGWGVNCAGPPAIASAQNGFGLADFEFAGNALGDTNCP